MRFVFGLLSGATLILLLAQFAGDVDRRWLARLPDWFDGLANAVGDALALPPRPPLAGAEPGRRLLTPADRAGPADPADRTDPAASTGSAAAPVEAPAQATAAAPASGLAEATEPASQPIPRPPDPRPVDAEPTAALPAAVPAALPAATAATAAAGDPAVAPAVADTEAPAAAAELVPQPVWVPFHSQMSASGFADRLSESLGHPFRVERRGPGHYQVVFGYRDESQRQALLAQAAELTGLQL